MPGRRTFWATAVVGWIVIGVAVAGVLRESARTHPVDFVKWFLGAALVHDLVLAPVVVAAGALAARVVPAVVRPVVTGAAIVAGTLALYAVPLLTGEGRRPSNPSALPDDYWRGLALVLAAVVAAGAALAAARAGRARARARPGPDRGDCRP